MQELEREIQSLNGNLFEIGFICGFFNQLKEILYTKLDSKPTKYKLDTIKFNKKKISKQIILIDEIYKDLKKEIKNNNLENVKNIKELVFQLYLNLYNKEDLNIEKDTLYKNISSVFIIGFLNGLFFVKNKFKTNYFLNNRITKFNFDLNGFLIKYKKIHNKHEINLYNINNKKELIKENFNIIENDDDFEIYSKKGEFLNSDFLMEVENKHKNKSLFIIELKFINDILFNNNLNIKNITDEEHSQKITKMLRKILNTTIIDNLNIKEENAIKQTLNLGLFNEKKMEGLFKLIKLDPNSGGILQALSYVESYLNFRKDEVPEGFNLNIYSLSNNNIYSLHEKKYNIENQIKDIKKTTNIYKNFDVNESILDITEHLNIKKDLKLDIDSESENNLNMFINNDLDLNKINKIQFQFQKKLLLNENNITSKENRQKHTKEFINSLIENDILISLGSPGIGKTTSIIGYLTQLENYVFIYSSSRIAVNEDIANKIINDSSNIFSKKENLEYYNLKEFDLKEFLDSNISFTINSDLTKNFLILINEENIDLLDTFNEKNKNKKRFYTVPSLLENSNLINESQVKDIDNQTSEMTNSKSEKVFESINNTFEEIINYTDKNKISATFALQAFNNNKKNFENLFYFLKTAISKNITNLIIMLDEITGTHQSYFFIKEIVDFFYNTTLDNKKTIKKELIFEDGKTIKLPTNFFLKLIVADASLSNKNVVVDYFDEKINKDDSKISISLKEKDEKTFLSVYKEKFLEKELNSTIFKGIDKIEQLNINSYPAKDIEIEYEFHLINRNKYDDDEYNEIESDILVEKIKNYLKDSKNENYSLLIFLQDKNKLNQLEKILKDENKINESLKDKILVLHSHTIKEFKKDLETKIKNAKIILATSTVSRGISFKNVNQIETFVPTFDFENQLNEIIQIIYRQRGNQEFDENGTKKLNFIIKDDIKNLDKNNDEIEKQTNLKYLKYLNLLFVYNILFLLESIIQTRIHGFYKFKKTNYFKVVPMSQKAIENKKDNNKINENIFDIFNEIAKDDIYKNSNKTIYDILKYENIKRTSKLIKNNGIAYEYMLNFFKKIFNINVQYYENDILFKLNTNLNKLVKKSDFKSLINKPITIYDENMFVQNKINFLEQYFFIDSRINFNIENNISQYNDKEIEEIKIIFNHYCDEVEKGLRPQIFKKKIIDFKDTINKILFYKNKNITHNNNEFLEKMYLIPIYPILFFDDLQKKEFSEYKSKIISQEINFLKNYSEIKFAANKNSILPLTNEINYDNKFLFILIGNNKFNLVKNKIFENKNISNISIFSFLNIIFFRNDEST